MTPLSYSQGYLSVKAGSEEASWQFMNYNNMEVQWHNQILHKVAIQPLGDEMATLPLFD
jgi:hypothetical protein